MFGKERTKLHIHSVCIREFALFFCLLIDCPCDRLKLLNLVQLIQHRLLTVVVGEYDGEHLYLFGRECPLCFKGG